MSKTEAAVLGKEAEIVHYEKYFGHAIVDWTINNFCLRTCKDNFFIHSQDFYVRGTTLTKWKLILNPKTNDRRISVTLRRLVLEPGPEAVIVDFRFTLRHSKVLENVYVVEKGDGIFKMGTNRVIDMHKTETVYTFLSPFDSDKLNVVCELIVIDGCNMKKVPIPPDIGIKCLSDDLICLYTERSYCDIILITAQRWIKAHKSILNYRNCKFAELLQEQNHDLSQSVDPPVIDLSQFQYETVNTFLCYIYSGSVKLFLMQPSIDLYDCVIFFQILDVWWYYLPDEMYLNTTVDVQEISHLWSISNFSAPNEFASPVLKEDSNATWRIHVSSNIGLDGTEYVNFAAEIIEGTKPLGVCVEFGVVDADQKMLCLTRILKNIAENELIGRKFSVRRLRDEINPYIENGTLHVVVRIRMAAGTYSNSPVKLCSNLISTNNRENPYYYLPRHMINMAVSTEFSDVAIIANDGEVMSYKCILIARSAFFSEEISRMTDDDDEIYVSISVLLLNLMLIYIYSGRIELPNYTFYPKIIVAAELLGIPGCKDSASLALQNIMSISNVGPILMYAEKYKDIELKNSAIKFIHFNYILVSQEKTWINLTKSHPSLIDEVTLMLGDKLLRK